MSSSSGTTGAGPWPEPDDIGTSLVPERSPGDGLAWDEPAGGSSKGVALAVAAMNLGMLLALPVLIVIGVYTFLTVYAVVKAFTAGSDAADPATVLVGVVGLVTLFTTLLGVGTWAIGRVADPKKRRSR